MPSRLETLFHRNKQETSENPEKDREKQRKKVLRKLGVEHFVESMRVLRLNTALKVDTSVTKDEMKKTVFELTGAHGIEYVGNGWEAKGFLVKKQKGETPLVFYSAPDGWTFSEPQSTFLEKEQARKYISSSFLATFKEDSMEERIAIAMVRGKRAPFDYLGNKFNLGFAKIQTEPAAA